MKVANWPQPGHWKSANSKMVTGASCRPIAMPCTAASSEALSVTATGSVVGAALPRI